MRTLYAGIDLHSNNSYLAILDQDDKRIFHKRLPNMADVILAEFEPYKKELTAIVVESTYNWYWLVDCLMGCCWQILLPCNSTRDSNTSMTNMTLSGWHIWPGLAFCHRDISIPRRIAPFGIY